MNISFFIAKRIYSDKGDKRKVSRPAIHIATAGVAIGLAVMILTVSVVLGFKHTIRDKVIGFGSLVRRKLRQQIFHTSPHAKRPIRRETGNVQQHRAHISAGAPGQIHVEISQIFSGIAGGRRAAGAVKPCR